MKKHLDILNNLSKTTLFKNMNTTDIQELLNFLSTELHTYTKGNIIINEDDSINNLSIVISGAVLIQKIDYWGNVNIKAQINEFEIFGETFAFLNSAKANCQVYAQTDCKILNININSILNNTSNQQPLNNQLLHNLLNIFASKNYLLTQKIDIMNKKTTREKLMEFLTQQSKQQHSNTIKIPFNRQELANYLSVDRSGLSTEISKLTKEGIITAHKNVFTLL